MNDLYTNKHKDSRSCVFILATIEASKIMLSCDYKVFFIKEFIMLSCKRYFSLKVFPNASFTTDLSMYYLHEFHNGHITLNPPQNSRYPYLENFGFYDIVLTSEGVAKYHKINM